MEIIPIGSTVQLKTAGDPIPAQVIGVQIRDSGKVNYEVAWWGGMVRYSEWVEPCEIEPGTADRMPIGFIVRKG